MQDRTEARKTFVGEYKKVKKLFQLALINYLKGGNCNGDVFDVDQVVEIMTLALSNADAPAAMWDGTDEETQDVLCQAMVVALDNRTDLMRQEMDELNTTRLDLETNLETDPVPAVQTNVSDPDDDDDEDDDEIPDVLYHGTPTKNIDSILRSGLLPLGRRNIYFQNTINDAKEIGAKHGELDVSVLSINPKDLMAEGINLENKDFGWGDVWYCKAQTIDPKFLKVVKD